jgi:proteasome activator subunit 4
MIFAGKQACTPIRIFGLSKFSRYLTFCRQAWGGLPTLFKEASKNVAWSGIDRKTEVEGLIVSQLLVQAGFVLTDPSDPRYQRARAHRQRFGQVLHRAAQVLAQEHEGKDHIDAVLVVNRSIDTYLTDYGLDANDFGAQQKNYLQAREYTCLSLLPKGPTYGSVEFRRSGPSRGRTAD